MPGVVQQWVLEARQEHEMMAHDELLNSIEQRYAPPEYETAELNDDQLESRDRIYESDWNLAQRAASQELAVLVAENPGKSYMELLAKYDSNPAEQTHSTSETPAYSGDFDRSNREEITADQSLGMGV